MPRPLPPGCTRERTRHGKTVIYVRPFWHGQRIRIRAEENTEEFWNEYRAAMEKGAAAGKPREGQTLRWAIDRYRLSSEWRTLKPATRRQRENIYLAVVASAGDEALAEVDQPTIRAGRERRKEKVHSANNFLKAMRGLFGWLVEEKIVAINPTIGVPLLKGANDKIGFHTWTEGELERFEKRWPVGTRERLAFDLLLYTGLRRGDAVRLGRQHVRDGMIRFRMEKTGEEIIVPFLAPLAASIAATTTGDLTYLSNDAGHAWVKESFGNWFRGVCTAAGCPGSAHGLRKAGATRAAMNGATVNQLMAMYGWTTPKMALHYTRLADRERLARAAGEHLLPARSENKSARTFRHGAGARTKTPDKSGR